VDRAILTAGFLLVKETAKHCFTKPAYPMFKELYQQLRNENGLCISIIIPTERGFQDQRKTEAELREARREAERVLRERGLDNGAVEGYLLKYDRLLQDMNGDTTRDGLGFFIGENVAERIDFPFSVDRQVVVDDSFEVRDLVDGMGRIDDYYVLTLSQRASKIFHGQGDRLTNITPQADGAEEVLDDPAQSWNFEAQNSDQELFHAYLQHIDKLLGEHLNERKLPVILGGPESTVKYFQNHSRNQDWLKGSVFGAFDQLSIPQMQEALAPVLESIRADKARERKDAMQEAIGYERYAAGLQAVWPAAQEGRVMQLLVERGYSCPAYTDELNYELHLEAPRGKESKRMEDAVDDLIELVLSRNGEVFFLDAGELNDHQQVAAILRY
jgi:hypothetical protein